MDFTFRVLHWCCYCRGERLKSSISQVSIRSVQLFCAPQSWLFFFKLLFAMIFLQSWLVLKAVVTGLGHTVFFLFIGVKEVFMLHNSPICISSVYWPSALRILQPRPAAKPKIQYWYWMKEKKKTLTHTDAYIHTCVDIQYVNGPLMWQKLDTLKKKLGPQSE